MDASKIHLLERDESSIIEQIRNLIKYKSNLHVTLLPSNVL